MGEHGGLLAISIRFNVAMYFVQHPFLHGLLCGLSE